MIADDQAPRFGGRILVGLDCGFGMRRNVKLRLATNSDVLAIATMSRDLIEAGLGWSWTAPRVQRSIACTDTMVLVAHVRKRVVAFAIMNFGDESAHLSLLAVALDYQRGRIGRRLVNWLEDSALVAGIRCVRLEVRANNTAAQAFYERIGYRKVGYVPGYYFGRESAIRMAHELGYPALAGAKSLWIPYVSRHDSAD